MNQLRASSRGAGRVALLLVLLALLLASALPADVLAQTPAPAAAAAPAPSHGGGEANIRIPDLSQSQFLGVNGRSLLQGGLAVCVLGLVFGLVIYSQLKNLPVHQSMREISELIYETCKTYLITQGKFILILEAFIGVIIVLYFGLLLHFEANKVIIILLFSLVGIAGSYGVAWFGIRINTFANSRTAFASLGGKPYPVYAIPLKAGMSIGMLLISVELFLMLCILLYIPGDYAGSCFIGFAIGESLGAAALRIAGGIFTKIADIGSDLMKIVFNIKEDDARNPGVIADCTGDNAGDSVGPSADGFETYGVTGVALISFIILAVKDPAVQVQLLVWIFVMRVLMIVASGASYLINEMIARGRYASAARMNFEAPLTSLVWLTSVVSVGMTYLASYLLIPGLGDGTLWWKLSTVITCGTLAGAIIPELVKIFTSTESGHVKGSGDLGAGRGRVPQHPLRPRGRQLQRLLARHRHRDAHGHRVPRKHHGLRRTHARARSVRLRPGGLRLPRDGAGDDRGRLLWSRHRQRAVRVRAVGDRDAARHQGRAQEGLQS
jgi:K(+)-stimulated pyrophosphate-energized sodium pump